jgi:hypothetical protein
MFGLAAGLLLFLFTLSIFLENTVFNEAFYKSAFQRLGTYEQVAELAGAPAKELTAKMAGASVPAFAADTSLETLVEENVSGEMVRLNTDALLSGLLRYARGETDSLPDLYLSVSDALTNINLQALLMCLGESRVTNLLQQIALVRFLLVHLSALLLFLLPLLLVLLSGKSLEFFYRWLRSTAFFYCLFGFVAALLLQFAHSLLLGPLMGGIASTHPSLAELIALHIRYFVHFLTMLFLLPGSAFYAAVGAMARLPAFGGKSGSCSAFEMRQICYIESLRRTTNYALPESNELYRDSLYQVLLLSTSILLAGVLLFSSIRLAEEDFLDRYPGQSLSFLWEGNTLSKAIDARDSVVCLLEVHVTDGSAKPAADVKLTLDPANSDTRSADAHLIEGITDQNGTAVFLLDKGSYTLTTADSLTAEAPAADMPTIDMPAANTPAADMPAANTPTTDVGVPDASATDSPAAISIPASTDPETPASSHVLTPAYTFDLETPGKSVLDINTSDFTGASLQYMP